MSMMDTIVGHGIERILHPITALSWASMVHFDSWQLKSESMHLTLDRVTSKQRQLSAK